MAKEKVKNLNRFTKLLPCKLTNDELLNYGNELGSIIQDITTEEDRQVGLKQELKARLAGLESRRTGLATKVTRKEEVRDVEVEVELDFVNDMYREIRLDTGEVITERPITELERQESMDLK